MYIRTLVACALLLCSLSTTAMAAAQPTVKEIDSVDGTAVGSQNLQTLTSVTSADAVELHLASYHCLSGLPCQPDGGEGLLVKNGTGCSATNTDGGSTFYDGHGNCWYRMNLNGDLRQWGVTKSSVFDADANLPPTLQSVASFIVNTVYPALAAHGISQLDTHQVSVYFDLGGLPEGVDIPITSSITCGATGGGPFTGGTYTRHPGTIYLRHGTYLHFYGPNDGSYIHHCIILPGWLLQPSQAHADCTAPNDSGGNNLGISFNSPPTSYADLEAIRANMVLCGDQGIFFDGVSGGYSSHVWISGFDNPVHILKSDHFYLEDTGVDGNICYYVEAGGGITNLREDNCNIFLNKDVVVSPQSAPGNTNCVQVDTANGTEVCSSEYWQIQDIEPSGTLNSYGRPDCRVTLVQGVSKDSRWQVGTSPTPPPVSLIPSSGYIRGLAPAAKPSGTAGDPVNYPMWIANLTPTTGALSCLGHGPFAVDNYSSGGSGPTAYVQLDLLESDYTMGTAYTMTATVTWDACAVQPCTMRVVTGDVDALEAGETILPTTDLPNGATISMVSRNAKGPDKTDGYIAEILVNQTLPVAHNTGSDTTISITSGGSTYAPSGSCDDAGAGQCAFFHAEERPFASNAPTSATYATVSTTMLMIPESNGHVYGAGYLDYGTPGLGLTNPFSYGHHFGYVVQDANSTNLINKAGDDNGELDDLGQDFLIISGMSNNFVATQRNNGKAGTGIINDLYVLNDASGHNTTLGAPITATNIGTGNTGLLISVASTSTLTSDQGSGHANGKGTGGLCPSTKWNSMTQQCTKGEEYVNYEIVDATHVLLLARGQRFSQPATFAMGDYLASVTITRPTGCDVIMGSSVSTTNPGLNMFENIGGCLSLVGIQAPAGKNIFIGHNATFTQITGSELSLSPFGFEDATAFATLKGCGNFLEAIGQSCFGQNVIAPTATASITLDGSAEIWPCDASAGTVELTVPQAGTVPGSTQTPPAGTVGPKYTVKKVDSSANACVVAMSGSDTLDGATSYLLTTLNQGVTFINTPLTTFWSSNPQAAPLAHGQVYLSYDSTNARLQLCPKNGSGLIVNFQMVSIPAGCLYLKNTSTTGSNVLDYIYVVGWPDGVSSVVNGGSGRIQVNLSFATPFGTSDQVFATCYGIKGTTEANISGLATMTGTGILVFNSGTYSNAYTGGGKCILLGLKARDGTVTGHSTASNGVETETGDVTKTLVGMVYVGASNSLNDIATARDVASWFNRRAKTCIETGLSATVTNTATTFVDLDSSKHCEFIAWGGNDVTWSLGVLASSDTSGHGAIAGIGFDSTTSAEAEQVSLFNGASVGIGSALSGSGKQKWA